MRKLSEEPLFEQNILKKIVLKEKKGYDCFFNQESGAFNENKR